MEKMSNIAVVVMLLAAGLGASKVKESEFQTIFTVQSFNYYPESGNCTMTLQDGRVTYNVEWRWVGHMRLSGCSANHGTGEQLAGRVTVDIAHKIEILGWKKGKEHVETWYIINQSQ